MKPIDIIVATKLIPANLRNALNELEDEGKLNVMLADDIELLSDECLKEVEEFSGEPSGEIILNWRGYDKSKRRNKSDRKRAPKWGRK